ncbi:MAG: hypothetical protein QM704_11140 [Anaeromyxobacteraceae bacterium]
MEERLRLLEAGRAALRAGELWGAAVCLRLIFSTDELARLERGDEADRRAVSLLRELDGYARTRSQQAGRAAMTELERDAIQLLEFAQRWLEGRVGPRQASAHLPRARSE